MDYKKFKISTRENYFKDCWGSSIYFE